MRKPFTILLFAALVVLLTLGCLVQVDETEYVIVARFGDPRRVLEEPGLYFKWPPPIDVAIPIDRRLHVLDPGPAEYLTSEKKNVLVSSFMAWRVAEPRKFLVTVNDTRGAEARLADIMASEVGSILGAHPLSVLVSAPGSEGETIPPGRAAGLTMEDVTQAITRQAAEKARQTLGVEVAAVRIKRLSFPEQNKQAVFRRMEAERERIAMQYRSEGEELANKLRSKTDREQAELLNAAAQSAAKIRGDADAEATRIYAEAYAEDPAFYEFLRSLEAYAKIIRENTTVVVPSDAELLRVLQRPQEFIRRDGEGPGEQKK